MQFNFCSKGVQSVPKAVYYSGFYDKHATAHKGRYSNLGPLTSQSGTLPLDHCDLLLLLVLELPVPTFPLV